MDVFGTLLPVLFIYVITGAEANPYCALSCNAGIKLEPNYLCKLITSERETKNCKLVNMTDETRSDIVNYFNHKRNKFALGHEEGYNSAANMQVLNYDMELEFFARAQGRFCDNSENPNTPDCIKTPFLYVDYIHTALIYNSKDEFFTGEDAVSKQLVHTFENWWKWPYDEDPLINVYTHRNRDFKAALMVWAQLDYIGCAMFRSPAMHGKYDLSIDCVCMFGSKDAPPRTRGDPIWREGDHCSRCPKGLICDTEEYKGLCGKLSTLQESHSRWQTNFWKNSKFSSNT